MAQAVLSEAANEICAGYAEKAATIWARMQRRFPLEDASTAPMVTYVFDENWVKFTIRYTVQFDRRRITKYLISARVLKAIDASGGAVSIASAAIELFPKTPFDIRQLTAKEG